MLGQFLPWKVTIFASVIDKWLVRRCFKATQISCYSDSGVLASIDGSCRDGCSVGPLTPALLPGSPLSPGHSAASQHPPSSPFICPYNQNGLRDSCVLLFQLLQLIAILRYFSTQVVPSSVGSYACICTHMYSGTSIRILLPSVFMSTEL